MSSRQQAIPAGFLEVGHIRRAHGLRGDVFVQLITNRSERLDAGSVLVTPRGSVTVESSRLLPNGRWVVKFDRIADRTDAESWTNVALHSEPIDDPDALWFHELIGSTVVEVDGTQRGTCVRVLDNPAADILELDSGALVPTNFVVSHVGREITIDVPDGLFDLADD